MCELRIDSRDPELASLQRREPRVQLRCQLDPARRAHERASRHPESCDSHVAEEVLDEVLRDGGVRELQQLERRVVEDRDLPAVLLVADPPLRGVAVYELPEGLAHHVPVALAERSLRLHILVARRGLREEVPAAARPLDRLNLILGRQPYDHARIEHPNSHARNVDAHRTCDHVRDEGTAGSAARPCQGHRFAARCARP